MCPLYTACPAFTEPKFKCSHFRESIIQVTEVTQPILKYLSMVAIQYNSTGLINTQYCCGYTIAHAGHAML
jgi:hypothetical protein